jgi:hypothetical protein
MELVAALVAEHVGFAKGGFRRRSRLLSIKEGLMRKIIALAILAVVAAAFFGLTVPRHVLNTFGFAMVHSAARRRQGRFRPYFGGREGRFVDPQRGSAGPVRRGCKQGEDLGGEPQGEVNRMWGASRAPPCGSIVSSPEQKPEDLDAILRGAGGFQGLAVQPGQGGPERI